jgi:serine carboxypeptidase-like clade 2
LIVTFKHGLDPLILWLNGGPGCSSLGGLFTEQGPFRPTKSGQSLYSNPYAWNNRSNVVFLESPAGVGFSYSNNRDDYKTGDIRTAADSVAFLEGFLNRYPEFVGRKFWVSGESYAGHYTIELVTAILEAKKQGRLSGLNLQGFAAGNAWTDPPSDNRGAVETWWNRALIDDSTYHCAIASCDFSKIGPLETNGECSACLATAQASFANINIYGSYEGPREEREGRAGPNLSVQIFT